jgi:hypothetical protein
MRAAGTALPFTYTPHPVVGMSPETLYSYLEGDDPLTGGRVVDEIIDALTKPVDGASVDSRPTEALQESRREHPAYLEADSEEELQRLFYEKGWTDGLPVILPTEERVERMLTGTGRARDEIVGEMFLHDTSETLSYTVSDMAVVAVMAGAGPEHFPVILAVASTKQSALTPSTTPFASMLLVNGPIRDEIGMNSGLAAFSPINLANAVIGRTWTLMSASWGFMRPRQTLWSSQGNNFIYNNMCVAENEERSVWAPFHVQKGFAPEESAVSIFRGWYVLNSLHAAAHRSVGEEITLQLSVIPGLNSNATIILDPLVALQLKETGGLESKEDFSRWISENAKIPAGRYWDTDTIDMLVAPLADSGVEPYASWRKAPPDTLIPHYHNPDNISILVIGGETSPVWKTTDYGLLATASVDSWRPGRTAADTTDLCSDGSCGLPDGPVEYDD